MSGFFELFSSERVKWKLSKAKLCISERAQKLQVNKPLFSSERVKCEAKRSEALHFRTSAETTGSIPLPEIERA